MNVKEAYDNWSEQYDSNINQTRDLEATALRETLADVPFNCCLEIGCGTGKNTGWLLSKAKEITAVDLSTEMLKQAKEKIRSENVDFIQADILDDWNFVNKKYDLVSFSLVLEHIEHLESIFSKTADAVSKGGYMYIGELHPFKQYSGSKARFTTNEGVQVVTCYIHHISDFVMAAKKHGFNITAINEYFDEKGDTEIPRIITLVFIKL